MVEGCCANPFIAKLADKHGIKVVVHGLPKSNRTDIGDMLGGNPRTLCLVSLTETSDSDEANAGATSQYFAWADKVTGTLYSAADGRCFTSRNLSI